MEITRSVVGGAIQLAVVGRMDGSWSDHLDAALSEAVREGYHDLRLELSGVVFLSSAGVGVLVRNYQLLTSVGGSLVVVNPSPAVDRVLRIARLADHLVMGELAPAGPAAPKPASPKPVGRRRERAEAVFDVIELNPGARLRAEVVGDDPSGGPRAASGQDVSLGARTPALALAVGAFGSGFADCRDRYGEMVSVVGGTACQPTDGTNAPDNILSSGALPSDVRVLHGLLCEGHFSHLVRFEPIEAGSAVGLGTLLACCREETGAARAGVVIVAETSGLVGAALRQSPAAGGGTEAFFMHPGVRSRLTFTAEPVFARSLALVAAVVATPEAGGGLPQLRPIGAGLVGHAHAAVFGFRLLKKGKLDLRATVTAIFEEAPLLGVLHLLHDDRGDAGAGESRFLRGACWAAPIDGEWVRAR